MGHELIHLKLEYPEALEAKKDMLALERNLLKTSETLGKFNSLSIE